MMRIGSAALRRSAEDFNHVVPGMPSRYGVSAALRRSAEDFNNTRTSQKKGPAESAALRRSAEDFNRSVTDLDNVDIEECSAASQR